MKRRPVPGKSDPPTSSDDNLRSSDSEPKNLHSDATSALLPVPKVVTLWIHDETFSKEDVLVNEDLFDDGIMPGGLVELIALKSESTVRDFSKVSSEDSEQSNRSKASSTTAIGDDFGDRFDVDRKARCLLQIPRTDVKAKHPALQISIATSIATTFGFRNRSQVLIAPADLDEYIASHVELGFRDIYLSRSDMWRLCSTELVGKSIYVGQKILFLGTIRLVVKSIHLRGRKVSTAYFDGTTVPIFRSEAARFVLFVQMSQEMWDFDSEGNGEILFNRVINGFLPELFQRWSTLEVKHLVSIVMFGRLEYTHQENEISGRQRINGLNLISPKSSSNIPYKDFYRVVVTDMASAQWTTILDELKKDFRVFLRDVCLQPFELAGVAEEDAPLTPRITGLPTSAMKGNILEAINIASSQFANDYVDRDLVRTGVSIVVVTAGTGVFEVDRDLLNLTSENLTNNGIGIDVVCLSKMPLHSAPLFKYKSPDAKPDKLAEGIQSVSESPKTARLPFGYLRNSGFGTTSVSSSVVGSTAHSLSRYASSLASDDGQGWCFGIPQWIDLSYWVPENEVESHAAKRQRKLHENAKEQKPNKRFVPRVRMYEIQMQGTEDSGAADIAIPYMVETQRKATRRRRMKKDKRQTSYTPSMKSGSASPNLVRRIGPAPLHSPSKFEGLLSSHAKEQGEVYNKMNEYDDSIFPHKSQPKRTNGTKETLTTGLKPAPLGLTNSNVSDTSQIPTSIQIKSKDALGSDPGTYIPSGTEPVPNAAEKAAPLRPPQASRISRTISLAFKGFAPAPRAVASTAEVNIAHAQAQPSQQPQVRAQRTLTTSSGSIRSAQHPGSRPQSVADMAYNDDELDIPPNATKSSTMSRPISINTTAKWFKTGEGDPMPTLRPAMSRPQYGGRQLDTQDKKGDGALTSEDEVSEDSELHPGSIPKTLLPFIRNVNASNPIKRDPNAAALYGRWQHLYPRKPKVATVKWRSLCTPASVPLTTEQFPTPQELENDYESVTYFVKQESGDELLENPQSRETLLQEMISIRLSHGYQLVVRPDLKHTPQSRPCTPTQFFKPSTLASDSNTIYFYMGNTIQQLSYSNDSHIEVNKFVRKVNLNLFGVRSMSYSPLIRTILSEKYITREMHLRGFSEEYPWEHVDAYLAGAKRGLNNSVEQLRFWRARFVLIPVEPPASAYKWMNDENEEEIHLRGIAALTQLWQKNRYIPPEERGKFKPSVGRKRDPNPLEIIFRTMNPSEVVATELDIAAEEPGDFHFTQLLPESELLERETATVSKIAQSMQSEKGIEIKNRRWHLKLHYNCFRGEEFINWILLNFKDITIREEAVNFGNELMEHGLFQHVNGKHAFKDGHFFYSVEPEYRVQKQDSKQSWFPTSRHRSDRSVPPTPISENVNRDSPLTVRSQSSSSANDGSEKAPSTIHKGSSEKKRVSVSLSKMIRLDVDHRRRSNRLEAINLHYDRLHNPENCYHMELSWLNVTSKLVEDSIVSWATQCEKYGLKLVEVPIAEASSLSTYEPFRSPYPISLATPPPQNVANTNNNYFTATSFGPQVPQSSNADVHIYQKSLLKRFNFVLDLEAPSEFPEDVEILYSWGRLEYRYTQFIHRSGVILAQITDDGSLVLAANRLYNTRYASAKSRDLHRPNAANQPAMQASGLIALNPPNTSSPAPSPMIHASADVLGPRAHLAISNLATYTTPEAIKDELETFCHDPQKLDAFYKEVTASMVSTGTARRKSSSTSSSVLRAFRPALGSGMEDLVIPEMRLPERLLRPVSGDEEGSGQSWRLTSAVDRPRGDVERPGRPRPGQGK